MKVLLTGGTGYLGSHTAVALAEAGYDLVLADNFANSQPQVLTALEELLGQKVNFWEVDFRCQEAVDALFRRERPDAVVHFAGYKAVGESVENPLKYYENNLLSGIRLLQTMERYACQVMIFSSSATVYSRDQGPALDEGIPVAPYNPYGQSKGMLEQIICDYAKTKPGFAGVNLRYFNPGGAHPSGLIGEDPQGIPNNLLPYLCQVYDKKLPELQVFGDDYDTVDGTGVRDYVHVCDLAEGHVAALAYALHHPGVKAINLGTGHGTSVLQIIQAFSQAAGVPIPYRIGPRRPGDLAIYYADVKKAKELLGWESQRTIDDICSSCVNYVNERRKRGH